MVQRVVVIGAGAAGLAVLRRFTARKESFEVICFEQLPFVGGLWNYCDNLTDPNHPTGSEYTAIYKYMRTNLPKQIMLFEGIPYPDDLPSYISHVDVKNYLDKFVDEFQLKKYIKFNKRVIKVDPKMAIGRDDVWKVRVEDVETKMEEEYEFDVVIVCNGKFAVPYYPKIEGMDVFKGQMVHSQKYKDPEEFKGKRVLVIGAGASGIDISIELSKFAEKIWLCHRRDKKLTVSKEICQVGEIIGLTSDSAIVCKISDDDDDESINSFIEIIQINHESMESELINISNRSKGKYSECSYKIGPIDVILFTTGFSLTYPFLSADCGLVKSSRINVGPLYKDLVCISRPTLSLIGLYNSVLPFTLFECQAKFLVALYEGRISMPRNEKKLEEELKAFNDMKRVHGVDVKNTPFTVPEFQWVYHRHLASVAGFDPPPFCIEHLYKMSWHRRSYDLVNYKNNEFKIGDDGLYVDA